MPKPKKEKAGKKEVGGHKGAVKEQALDEPSRVGSSIGHHNEKDEVNTDAKRYASITGDQTPPREIVDEKM
jgi:ATP-binding cassette subfamily G (WHITE) protein 2 (PDR)